jgi:hypothetical protein
MRIQFITTVEIDVEQWAVDYGFSPNDTDEILEDAREHLGAILQGGQTDLAYEVESVEPAENLS